MFSTDWIEAVQAWSTPALDMVFRFFSGLGDVTGFTILVAFLYLCIDRRLGYLLTVAVVATNTLNPALKGFFDMPRPPEALHKVSVAHFDPPRSLAFPSGHAQSSGTFWPILAARFQYRWFWIFAAFMASMVSISRVFLGVHYIGDIVAGLVIGIVVAVVALVVQRWLSRRVSTRVLPYRIALAVGAPLLLLLLDRSTLTLYFAGAVSGMGLGYLLEPYLVSQERATNFVAFVGGLVLFFAVDELLKMVSGPALWYFVRGFVALFVVAIAGPWLGHKWEHLTIWP